MIDGDLLVEGVDYDELNLLYIIFIVPLNRSMKGSICIHIQELLKSAGR